MPSPNLEVLYRRDVAHAQLQRYPSDMPRSMQIIFTLLLVLFLISSSAGRPKLTASADRFPAGQATPEGTASDLVRAFIARDPAWFRRVCIRPYGNGQARAEYVEYLNEVTKHMRGK